MTMSPALRFEQATTKAVALLEQFSEQDPLDPESDWEDPERIFDQLDVARREVMEAWNELQMEDPNMDRIDELAFRARYLDMITDAFADVLDELRKHDNVDVGLLVDCLQSGIDFLTSEEKELFMDDDPFEEEDAITPHENHRRELGFHITEIH